MAQATNTTLGEIKLAGDLAGSNDALLPELTPTGVSAGSYVFPTLTVDGKGRISSIHSGTDAEVASLIPGATKTQKGIVQVGDNIEVTTSNTAGFYQIAYSPSLVGSNDSGLVYEPCRPFSVTVISDSGSIDISYVPAVGGSTIDAMITSLNTTLSGIGSIALVSGNLRLIPTGNGAGSYITLQDDCLFSKIAGASTITSGFGQDTSTIWVKEATTSDFGVMKTGIGLSSSAGIVSVVTSQIDKATDVSLGIVKTGTPSVSGIDNTAGSISLNQSFINSNIPVATNSTLGSVKTGSGVINTFGIISVDPSYVNSNVPVATTTVLGGIKVGTGLSINSGVLSVDAYPVATGSTFGTVKIDTSITNTAGLISIPMATNSSPGLISGGSGFSFASGILSVDKATPTTAGVVKVGPGLTVIGGYISFDTSNLPPATTSTKGVVQIGAGVSVAAGVVSVSLTDATTSTKGVVQVTSGGGLSIASGVVSYDVAQLPVGTNSVLGIVKVGSGLSVTAGVISVDNAAIPLATSSVRGTVKVSSGNGLVYSANILSFDPANLPAATTGSLGVVQIGSGLSVTAGVISVTGTNAGLATVNNFTNSNYSEMSSAVFSSGSWTPNLSLGNVFDIGTLTGNVTINNPTNLPASGNGQSFTFYVTQDGTGNRSITWGSNFKFVNGITTINPGLGKSSIIRCFTTGNTTEIFAEIWKYA